MEVTWGISRPAMGAGSAPCMQAAHLVVVQLRLVGGRLQGHLQRPHVVDRWPIGNGAIAVVLPSRVYTA